MKDKQNTGLTLLEVWGPLTTLMARLLGKNAKYWLTALNKFLREGELPQPPAEVLQEITPNSRKTAHAKLQKIVDYLKTIPTVHDAKICVDDDDDLINIEVYRNLPDFLHETKDIDHALFVLTGNAMIGYSADATSKQYDDAT